jgi:NADPH:quinone reductase-like Zn-dependent oxidoreductase
MNPMDMQIADGGWKDRMPAKFPMVLGADLGGAMEEAGPGASRFAPGHEPGSSCRRRLPGSALTKSPRC